MKLLKNIFKSICFVLIIGLLSGCTVKYDLTINLDKTLTETISGRVTSEELYQDEDKQDINIYIENLEFATPMIDNEGVYNKSITEESKYKEFVFTYNYNQNYSKSNVLNQCFQNINYEETDNEYVFDLSGQFYCLLSKKVEINLISSYGVLENNADKVKGNKYTWIINNPDDVNIHAIITKDVIYSERDDNLFTIINIVGFSLFAVVLVISIVIYKKKSNDDI